MGGFTDVLEQDFNVQATPSEDDGGDLCLEEALCDSVCAAHDARANAQLAVHDRRVVADEVMLSRWRTALLDEHTLGEPRERLRQLKWVGYGRRAAHEHRI